MFFSSRRPQSAAPLLAPDPGVLELRGVDLEVESAGESRLLLSQVSLRLEARRTALVGLNGSGKSSLLRLFKGLLAPSRGQVLVEGLEAAQGAGRVGLLFSDPAAQLIMPTPLEDIELSLQKVKDRELRQAKALEALGQVGLTQRAYDPVFQLSGGERQLAALASLLAADPRILLLDEPTTLLDLRNRLNFLRVLDSLDQQQIISTHDLDLAATCDQVLILHQGRLLQQGEPGPVLERYRAYCTWGFPGEEKPDPSAGVAPV